MRVARRHTTEGQDVYATIAFRTSPIVEFDHDGNVVFSLESFEAPESWSQETIDFFAKQILYRGPIPTKLIAASAGTTPKWLWRKTADEDTLEKLPEAKRTTTENSVKQVFDRVAGTWTWWGWLGGYFDTETDARSFYDETRYLLARQHLTPNLAQWKNLGLHWAYGLEATSPLPLWHIDHFSGEIKNTTDAHLHPLLGTLRITPAEADNTNQQPSAINEQTGFDAFGMHLHPSPDGSQKIEDYLGARLGPSAKRQKFFLDAAHPYASDFIRLKRQEAYRSAALQSGARLTQRYLNLLLAACDSSRPSTERFDPARNPDFCMALKACRDAEIPENLVEQTIALARQGQTSLSDTLTTTEGEESDRQLARAGASCGLLVNNRFLDAVTADKEWVFTAQEKEKPLTTKAKKLWDEIGAASWASANPELLFSDSINEWNPCLNSARIEAADAQAHFFFLNDSAALTAGVNLAAFQRSDAPFDTLGLEHTVKLATLALEIAGSMAGSPEKSLAKNNHDYRTIAIRPHNFAATLMRMGLAYESTAARAVSAAMAAIITGTAYTTSAELAEEIGAFNGYSENRTSMLRVLRNHRRCAQGETQGYEKLSQPPLPLTLDDCPDLGLVAAARRTLDRALELGQVHGFRNAQVTAIADDRDEALLLGAESAGLSPLTAHIRVSPTPQGTYKRYVSESVSEGLRALGYQDHEREDILRHALGHGNLKGAPIINIAALRARGFDDTALAKLERALVDCTHILHAFNRWTLGDDFCITRLGVPYEQLTTPDFDLLRALGFSGSEIEAANIYCCGSADLANAPHLKPEHQAVFKTETPQPENLLALLTAIQPHLSGGISQTILLPRDASILEVQDLQLRAAKAGLKSIRLYRLGSAISEPAGTALYASAEAWAPAAAKTSPFAKDWAQERSAAPETVFGSPPPRNPQTAETKIIERIVEKIIRAADREKLPDRRKGYTQKAVIGGHKIYLRTGEYEDGRLGEIFIDMHKEGAAFRSLINNFAIAISLGLQYGVPLDEYVDAFVFTRFEPAGAVEGNEAIQMATSILDYVFRELAISYMGRKDLANAEPHDLLPDALGTGKDSAKPPQIEEPARLLTPIEAIDAVRRVASTGYLRGGLRVVNNDAFPLPDDHPEAVLANIRQTIEGATALNLDYRLDNAGEKPTDRRRSVKPCPHCGEWPEKDETGLSCLYCGEKF